MNYNDIRTLLEQLKCTYEKICEDVELVVAEPATIEEVEKVEQELGRKLPVQIRDFFLQFSKECSFSAFLPDDMELPDDLEEIFSATFVISLDEVVNAEGSRKSWAEECFSDEEDEYDKVWHNKLGLMTVGNGDVIAFDTGVASENAPVVYLSHDDGEGHGYVLGKDFCSYLENLLLVGACGNEDWQVLPFCENQDAGINPLCANADAYREIIGFDIKKS